jgi:hypothetical protein
MCSSFHSGLFTEYHEQDHLVLQTFSFLRATGRAICIRYFAFTIICTNPRSLAWKGFCLIHSRLADPMTEEEAYLSVHHVRSNTSSLRFALTHSDQSIYPARLSCLRQSCRLTITGLSKNLIPIFDGHSDTRYRTTPTSHLGYVALSGSVYTN